MKSRGGRGHKTGRDGGGGTNREDNQHSGPDGNIRGGSYRRNNYGNSVETNPFRGSYQNPTDQKMNGRGDEVGNRSGYNASGHRGGVGGTFGTHYGSPLLFGPDLQGFIGFVANSGHRKLGIQEMYRILDEYTSNDKISSGVTDSTIPEVVDDKVVKCISPSSTPSIVADNPDKNEHPIPEKCSTVQTLEENSVEMENRMFRSCLYPRNFSYISLTTTVDTVIFINSKKNRPSPKYYTDKIYEDLLSGICKEKKFEHLDRFLPVDVTVSAYSCDDVISRMKKLMRDNFPHTGYVSFNVECDVHDPPPSGIKFNRWTKEEMTILLQQTACGINPDAYISLYQPSYLICVHVVNSVACLSVMSNAAKYHLYNLEEFK